MMKHKGDEHHLLLEIFKTYQVMVAGFSRLAGVPASRFALMRLIAISEEGIGVTELARKLDINSAAVSRQVKEMEKDGIVVRRSDSRDHRKHYIILSEEGLTLFGELHSRAHELENNLEKELGRDDLSNAARVLSRLRHFVETL